ncbi:MAG: mechanosensitive ion channel [Planctomycetota bacterium]|nr:mechanosensitive ion channel [Planctomycetota bacterium]
MSEVNVTSKKMLTVAIWAAIATWLFVGNSYGPELPQLPSGGTLWSIFALVACILATTELLSLITYLAIRARGKPPAEALMIGRLYWLVAILAICACAAFGIGKLDNVAGFFAAFGGMLLGWSLQAPVSGFAAYVLISLKRPIRPGDRVQFPSLNLVGDVKDIGAMYTVLDQVGGSIGSEEPVGRYVLVPNAMLFSQVVINYTVKQDAAYMLDEVVARITYDSDWKVAEKILIDAARGVTKEIIEKTGVQPYIRSDMYDYGVYLRLRYQTSVKDRTEIASEINKRIFIEFQKTPAVDLAIPFIYSYRAGAGDKREADLPHDKDTDLIESVAVERVAAETANFDPKEIDELATSISSKGLLQPIIVTRNAQGEGYQILAGDKRFAACKKLGWKTVPVLVQGARPAKPAV